MICYKKVAVQIYELQVELAYALDLIEDEKGEALEEVFEILEGQRGTIGTIIGEGL